MRNGDNAHMNMYFRISNRKLFEFSKRTCYWDMITRLFSLHKVAPWCDLWVSRNNCKKSWPHVGAWSGTLRNPMKCLWHWEPDRRSNFFSPPGYICAVTYITEIPLHLTLRHGPFDIQGGGGGAWVLGPGQDIFFRTKSEQDFFSGPSGRCFFHSRKLHL